MVAFGVVLPWLAGWLLEEGMVSVARQGRIREMVTVVIVMANGRDGVAISQAWWDSNG